MMEAPMSPRRTTIACFAVLALLGASCGDFPDENASANELATASSPVVSTASPSPREFLEVGADESPSVTEQPVTAAAPAPKSIDRWE